MSSEDDSISSTSSLLLSPSDSSTNADSTTNQPQPSRPSYGWDQVQDILDTSDDNSKSSLSKKSANKRDAIHREIDLAMVDLTAEQKHKLSILMKDDYYKRHNSSDDSASCDEVDVALFSSPSLITSTVTHSPRKSVGKTTAHNIGSNSPGKRARSSPAYRQSPATRKNNPMDLNSMSKQSPSGVAIHSRQSPASVPSRQQQQQQRTASPFGSPFSGGFGSPLKIEELIGSSWGKSQRSPERTQQKEGSGNNDQQKQSQSAKRRARKKRSKHSPTQSLQTISTPDNILSPPQDASILSAFQSVQDTLDAALHDLDTTLQQSARRERRLEEEGEMMTPEFIEVKGAVFLASPPPPQSSSAGIPLKTWQEEDSADVNLALALDFDVVAREDDVDAKPAADVEFRVPNAKEIHDETLQLMADAQCEKSVQDPVSQNLLRDFDNEKLASGQQHMYDEDAILNAHVKQMDARESLETVDVSRPHDGLPTPSPHPIYPTFSSVSNIVENSQSTVDEMQTKSPTESIKPNHSIPIPSPQPIHPTLIATHTSSFDNTTTDDEEDLKPIASLPMPSPQPVRPDLSNRSKVVSSKIPRLPPQDKEADATTSSGGHSRVKSVGRRSKVHPTTTAETATKETMFKSLKPRDSLKSSVKAMFKRSNPYGGESSDQIARQNVSSRDQKNVVSKARGVRMRSNSDASEPVCRPKRHLRVQTTSSFDSTSLRRQHSGSSHASDTPKSLDAPSSPSPASQRRKEYDEKLRAARAAKLKRKHDAKITIAQQHSEQHSSPVEENVEMKHTLVSHRPSDEAGHTSDAPESLDAPSSPLPASQRRKEYDEKLRAARTAKWKRKNDDKVVFDQQYLEHHSTPKEYKKSSLVERPSIETEVTQDAVNDVVDLLSESLDTPHMIYDDDLEAIAAAELDESFEFEANEKRCSEVPSSLVNLKPRVLNSYDQLETAHSQEEEYGDAETLKSIAESADDILTLCVDGQTLAEDEDLFYDALDFTSTTPVQRVLYEDNYDHVAALESAESREFTENELYCSGASMFEDALEYIAKSPRFETKPVPGTPAYKSDRVYQRAASAIQNCYRRYQMQNDQLCLRDCETLLQPDLYDCVERMQGILSVYPNDESTMQQQNYLDYYDDIMTLFNSKIREMDARNLRSGASNAAKIQRHIHTLHNQKDYRALKVSLSTLQTRISDNIVAISSEQNAAEPLNTNLEMHKYYRGHLGVISMQSRVRGMQARSQMRFIKLCILKLQAWARMALDFRRYHTQLAALNHALLSHSAAIKIQSCTRGMVVRRHCNIHRICYCIVIVQSIVRGCIARTLIRAIRSAIKMQSCARSMLIRTQFEKRKRSIQKLQSFVRMGISIKNYRRSIVCVTILQASFRGAIARRMISTLRAAAIKLQSYVRSTIQRSQYLLLKLSIVALQGLVRERLMTRNCQATIIQVHFRGSMQRHQIRKMICGFVKLQAFARGMLVRGKSAQVERAILCLQSFTRMIGRKKKFCSLIGSIISLQAAVRGHNVRRSHFQARAIHFNLRRARVVRIQAAVRGASQRYKYKQVLEGAILFQALVRGAMARESSSRRQVVIIKMQSLIRRHTENKRYRRAVAAVIVIQRFARQLLQQKACALLAALKIQSLAKVFIYRCRYEKTRMHIVTIQSLTRSMLVRDCISKQHSCAVLIQSFFRFSYEKRRYQRLIAGLTLLQARVRSHQCKLLVCSKVAANVAWNDLIISTENKVDQSVPHSPSNDDTDKVATLLQSVWRAFRAKIEVARKLLLSCKIDCYYPSHIKNQLSFLRAGILVLKVANKGNNLSSHVASVCESDMYSDIHWRETMTVDLSSAFGRTVGTFNSQVTLVIKFRRRRTESYCKSHKHFIRATLLYALQRETKALEAKSIDLILTFIQTSLVKARVRQCQDLLRLGDTEMESLQTNAIKIQRYWRSCLYVLSDSERHISLTPPSSRAASLRQLFLNCIRLQAVIRGYLIRRHQTFLSKKASTIQRAWSLYIARSKLKTKYPIINHLPLMAFQRIWKEKRSMVVPESVTSTSSGSSVHSSPSPPPSPKTSGESNRRVSQSISVEADADFSARTAAAMAIQSHARMALCQLRYCTIRKGIVKFQSRVRGGNARMVFYVEYAATIKLQAFARRVLMKKANALTSIDEMQQDMHHLAKLQATIRGHLQNTRFIKLRKGCSQLQARVRGKKILLSFKKAHASSIVIQSMIRGALTRDCYKRFARGVQLMQAQIRGHQQMVAYKYTIRAVILIQSLARQKIESQSYAALTTDHSFAERPLGHSVVKIQAFVRKTASCKRYNLIRRDIVKCQATIRGVLARSLAFKMKSSAVIIQSRVRQHLTTHGYITQKLAIVTIQSWARAACCQLQYSATKKYLGKPAKTIQLAWRRYNNSILSNSDLYKQHIAAFENAVMVVQRKWRLSQDVRENHEDVEVQRFNRSAAATLLQSWARESAARRKIEMAYHHASRIQHCYRKYLPNSRQAHSYMREEYTAMLRLQYERLAAVTIQCRARVWLSHREFQLKTAQKILITEKEVQTDTSARKLQSLARAAIIRCQIKSAHCTAFKIQRCYRAYIVRSRKASDAARAANTEDLRGQRKRVAAVSLQSIARMWISRNELFRKVLAKSRQERAARSIQSFVRSWLRHKTAAYEKELKSAIDLIAAKSNQVPSDDSEPEFSNPQVKQNMSLVSMQPRNPVKLSSPVSRLETEHYEKVSAQVIQKVARGWLCRSHLLLLNRSAERSQQLYQTNDRPINTTIFKLQKENDTDNYVDIVHLRNQSSIAIQSLARKFIVRSKYFRLNQSAAKIQTSWKSITIKNDALSSELYQDYCCHMAKLNAKIYRVKQHEDEVVPIDKEFFVCVMQSIWRGALVRKQKHIIYTAVTTIQNAWRRHCEANAGLTNDEFRVAMQCLFRIQAHLHRKRRSSAAITQSQNSVVLIQAFWRGALERRQQAKTVDAAVVIQNFLRTHLFSLRPNSNQQQEHAIMVSRFVSFQRHVRKTRAAECNAAAILVQNCIRTHQAKTRYSSIVQSATYIQTVLRMYIAKKSLRENLQQKRHIIRMQSAVRTSIVRSRVKKQTTAASVIQNRFRTSNERNGYKHLIKSVIILQSFARMVSAKNVRNDRLFRCLAIQRAVRNFLRCHQQYRLSSKAATIQKAWLRYNADRCIMQNVEEYSRFVNSLASTQMLIRRRSSRRHEAAKKIQVLYFSWKMRKSLAKVLNSVVQVQKMSRRYLQRLDKEKHRAATLLQRFFRARFLVDTDSQSSYDESEDSDYLPSEVSEEDSSSYDCGPESESYSEEVSSASSIIDQPGENFAIEEELHAAAALIVQRFLRARRKLQHDAGETASLDNFVGSSASGPPSPIELADAIIPTCVNHSTVVTPGGAESGTKVHIENTDSIRIRHVANSVVLLQSIARGASVRKKMTELCGASVVVQRAWHDHKSVFFDPANRPDCFEDAIVLLQYKWRRAMKAADAKRRELAAIKIQSLFRMLAGQRKSKTQKNCARNRAAVLLQSNVRTWLCKQELALVSFYAMKIQHCSRKYIVKSRKVRLQRQMEYGRFLEMQKKIAAAVAIQSIARCWSCRRQLALQLYINEERAAITIQSIARMRIGTTYATTLKSTSVKQSISAMPNPLRIEAHAATKIQTKYRDYMSSKEAHNLVVAEAAAAKIQMLHRRFIKSSQRIKSRYAIQIQTLSRMAIARHKFSNKRAACVKIQNLVRKHQCQNALKKKLHKIVILQCWSRMLVAIALKISLETEAMQNHQAQLVENNSAITLQRFVRGYIIRHQFGRVNTAARTIQRAQKRSVARLRNKLLRVFQEQSPSNHSYPAFKRSNSALLPKDTHRYNRVREIAPHLPRENGVFVEVILNSVAVVIQSSARRYIALKEYKAKLEAARQRNKEEMQTQTIQVNYADNVSKSIRRRCTSPSITDVEDSVHFSHDDPRLKSRAVRIQSIFRGSHVRKEQSICNSSASVLQNFFRRHNKPKCKSESSNASIGSSCSKSSYRFSTEDENHALLEQIYQQAEAQARADSESVCVSQYAWRLCLATEQELMFDG
ncbi:hypothetical protein ACHAWO_004683 [Cyclotella atomus]|uniref:Uncharacterized protein n=1 Tax=Cyclotella atomus TaxID=382360 RepID=A0ABD3QI55_9STRA